MIAKQSVYLTADRKTAVPEGDKGARFLLVREGHEVNDAVLDRYENAESLVGAKRKGPSVDESRPTSSADTNEPKPAAAAKTTPRRRQGSRAK
jgi:hypothetical protein